jgi:hypothetical protein
VTPKQHNRTIGIMHLVWGCLNLLAANLLVPFILMLLGPMGSDPTPRLAFWTVYRIFLKLIIVFSLVFSAPPLVAGYAMLTRRAWGRAAGIVSACFTAFSIPFGLALTVYTLWFLCGQQGGQFYGKAGLEGAREAYVPRSPEWRS